MLLDTPQIAVPVGDLGAAALVAVSLVAALWKANLIRFGTTSKQAEPPARDSHREAGTDRRTISRAEFDTAMASLQQRIDDAQRTADEARAQSSSASAAIHQIAQMIETSMRHLGDRFDDAISRIDTATSRIIDRIDNHETRLSRTESTVDHVSRALDAPRPPTAR